MSAAQDGDTIIVAAGAYSAPSLIIQKSINILGPADRSAIITSITMVYFNAIWGDMSGVSMVLTGASQFFQVLRNIYISNCHVEASGYLYLSLTDMVWKNCTFVGPDDGSANGLTFQPTAAAQFINNTITGFTTALNVTGADPGLVVRNTILDNIDDLTGVQNTTGFKYNLISDGDLAGINGNITGASPQFVDAANGDYHLQANAFAIDAGNPDDPYALEPENNGGRVNIGAYGNTTEATTSGSDVDGDGLTDKNEQCFDGYCDTYDPYDPVTNPGGGDTDINKVDTDADGYSDGYEVTAGSDPTDSNSTPIYGDISGDGVVNIADIALGYRIVLNLLTPTSGQLLRGDVAPLINGAPAPDGQFTAGDVLLIIRKSLGLVNF